MSELPLSSSRARIVDASLNRIAEALRVAEDICRFGWDLPGLARELKDLRHRVLAAHAPTAEVRSALAAARDIEEDVGRRAPAPAGPADLAAVAVRNLQRAKEALRTLEEVRGGPAAAGEPEELRYRLYSIEKGLLRLAARGPRPLVEVRLYLLATASLAGPPLLDAIRAAMAGGVDAVQLREKSLPDRRLLALAREIREATARAGALFIVNDRPDIARLSGADGVHLGQEDLPVGPVRSVLGDGFLVGVSTHSLEEARRAVREGADYIGVGPAFPTRTKEVAAAPLGPAGVREILEAVDVPGFAIGGIRPESAADLGAAGVRRAAVSAGILGAGDLRAIEAAARAVREKLAS
jgi:thiamine-phosphate pyrophosphorylase